MFVRILKEIGWVGVGCKDRSQWWVLVVDVVMNLWDP